MSLFTASPQGDGEASIWSIDTRSPRAARPMISGLTAVGDIVCGADGPIVLENFLFLTPAIARLSVYQRDGKRTLAEAPAPGAVVGGMAQDPVSGAIYFARTGFDAPGEVVRVATR